MFLPLAFLLAFCTVALSQKSDSTQKLVPVESLISKIKPDTSHILSEMDTSKVDTVYIENPMNVLKAGADLTSAYGMGFIAYERVLAFMGTAQLKVEFIGKYNPFRNASFIKDAYDNTSSIAGIGLVPEGRYYGSEKYAPKGFFVGIYFPLRFATATVPLTKEVNGATYSLSTNKLSYSLIGVGFNCGYHLVLNNKWSLEALLGFSIARGKFSEEFYTRTINFNGVPVEDKMALKDGTIGRAYYPRVEITFGRAFGKK